jgi:hypothetical protein
MYRLTTVTGESLIARDVEGNGLSKIYGCIPASLWRDRTKLGEISRIASTQAYICNRDYCHSGVTSDENKERNKYKHGDEE